MRLQQPVQMLLAKLQLRACRALCLADQFRVFGHPSGFEARHDEVPDLLARIGGALPQFTGMVEISTRSANLPTLT